MNLASAFLESARAHAARPALFWGERTFSYAEVAELTQRLAARLTALGVQPGDRVGLWLKNCPEFVPALLGVLAADAVVVPINNFLKPAEVGYILNDAGINLLLTDADLAAQLPALQALRPGLQAWSVEDLPALPPAPNLTAPARAEGDLAVLIYTSGTTGHPKGAMLSHGNLLHNVASCRQALGTLADDRMVVMLPLFHSYMVCVGLLLPLLSGGAMVLIRSLHPLKNLLTDLLQHRGTILPAIPQFYRSLVAAPPLPPLPLRLCVSGAAPLPVQVLRDFEARFNIPLIEGYGLSEASPVVAKNPINGVRKPGSIGRPIPNVEVSVQDDAGRLLGPGEVGEICVRGGNVMLGYWNRPEETARAFRDGWLLTGDVGYMDADGYFFITDRKKDMLLVNGINVYPREIEEVLYQFPGIREAAVIGRPDPRRGEQPLAFVALDEGATLDPAAVLQFLRERLADYKVPKRVEVLPALPRNATGKILKTALREQAAGLTG
ncbi:MAG: long-chain-fatty-acid--CoA ligase [Limisphaerales bacterium]|jgi:long-chain acyl-CoA synthetase